MHNIHSIKTISFPSFFSLIIGFKTVGILKITYYTNYCLYAAE